MAEFCLECLKKFEPNANEYNTTISIESYLCEGCGEIKPIVVTFDDGSDRCKHCYPPFKHFGKHYYIRTGYSQDPTLYVLRRDDTLGGVMIDYCPMCGRKLDEPIEGYILEE